MTIYLILLFALLASTCSVQSGNNTDSAKNDSSGNPGLTAGPAQETPQSKKDSTPPNVPTYESGWPTYTPKPETHGYVDVSFGKTPFVYNRNEGRDIAEIQDGTQPLLFGYGRTFFMDDLTMAVLVAARKDGIRTYQLKRINRDGDIEKSYGKEGFLPIAIPGESSLAFLDGVTLADNSMVLAFQSELSGNSVYMLKILSGGALDPNFGKSGILKVADKAFREASIRIGRKDASRVMIVDADCEAMGSDHTLLDLNTGGMTKKSNCTFSRKKYSIALDFLPNHYSVLASCDSEGCVDGLLIERFDSDGNKDQSFADQGVSRVPWSTFAPIKSHFNDRFEMRLGGTKDGKVLISWSYQNGVYENRFLNHIHLTRVLRDGKIDESFGEHGTVKTFTPLNPGCSNPGLGSQPSQPIEVFDGKIFTSSVGDHKVCVLRLNRTGYPDKDFAYDGIATTSTGYNDVRTNDPYGPNGYFDLAFLGMQVEPNGTLTVSFSTSGSSMLKTNSVIANRYLY